MIQRIQSVYLLLAFLAAVALFFVPVGDLTNNEGFKLYLYLEHEWYLMLMAGAIAAINLITIFLYKMRKTQILLCFINLVLTAAFMFVIIMNVEEASQHTPGVDGVEGSYTWGTFLPFLIIILISLALRGIKKDEALVRSMDRLR